MPTTILYSHDKYWFNTIKTKWFDIYCIYVFALNYVVSFAIRYQRVVIRASRDTRLKERR